MTPDESLAVTIERLQCRAHRRVACQGQHSIMFDVDRTDEALAPRPLPCVVACARRAVVSYAVAPSMVCWPESP